MRTMYDAIYADRLPPGAGLYAGYVDGEWPSAAAIAERFPHALVVRIATSASTDDGIVLDVEQRDATPEEAVNWVLRRRAAGADPTVYCSMSTWPTVRAAFATHDVPQPHWWIAAYVDDPSKPPTQVPAGAVALQWYDFGGYDTSLVADHWPGVDPTPAPPRPPVPAHQILEEDTMLIIDAPVNATGPRAMFLLTGSAYVHIPGAPTDPGAGSYAALAAAGLKTVVVDWDFHQNLIKAHGATAVTA